MSLYHPHKRSETEPLCIEHSFRVFLARTPSNLLRNYTSTSYVPGCRLAVDIDGLSGSRAGLHCFLSETLEEAGIPTSIVRCGEQVWDFVESAADRPDDFHVRTVAIERPKLMIPLIMRYWEDGPFQCSEIDREVEWNLHDSVYREFEWNEDNFPEAFRLAGDAHRALRDRFTSLQFGYGSSMFEFGLDENGGMLVTGFGDLDLQWFIDLAGNCEGNEPEWLLALKSRCECESGCGFDGEGFDDFGSDSEIDYQASEFVTSLTREIFRKSSVAET